MTTATGSCDFCGTRGFDPDYPCLLGCTRIPTLTTPTQPTSEFIEPGTCEWGKLAEQQVCENSIIIFYHFWFSMAHTALTHNLIIQVVLNLSGERRMS